MKKDKKFITLIGAAFLTLACVAICVIAPRDPFSVRANGSECVHDGFHYEYLAPTVQTDGHKEFWTCCKCHTVSLTELTGNMQEGDKEEVQTRIHDFEIAYLPALLPVSSFNITAHNSTVLFEKEAYAISETAKFSVTPNSYFKVTKVEANGVEVSDTEGWYSLTVSSESNSVVVTTDYDPIVPTIVVVGGTTTFNALEDNSANGGMTLPNVSATDCYGSPLTPTVTYKFNGETATDPGYNSESVWAEGEYAIGTHEWTFTATDTHDITKVASKTVTLNVYRRLLTDGGEQGTITNPLSNNPSYTNSNAGYGFAGFYMDRSFNYYVEMTVSGVTGTDGNVGFLHTISDKQTGFNSIGSKWIYDNFGFNRQHKIAIDDWSDTCGIWEHSTSWQSRHLKSDSAEYIALNSAWEGNTNKIAAARIGSMFYIFLNDYLFDVMNVPQYSNVPTSAGIGTNKNNLAHAVMSNFVFVEGEAATVSKVDSLLAKSPMFVGARTEMQNNIYVTTGLGEDRTDGSYVNVAQTPNDDQYYYATAVRSKYLMSNAGTVIDYDFEYDMAGSGSHHWGLGYKFSTMFMDPNCTIENAVSDSAGGNSANGFIIDMAWDGLATRGSGVPSYGGEVSGYCIHNQRATNIDCATFNSIFTSGRTTKFHFHIEIKDGVFKYVVSDANNSEATMTFTDTASKTFKYYYQCFTFSKGAKVSITNYKVASL